MLKKLKLLRLNICQFFFCCLPLKKNKVIVWANSFKSYGDSPKYITEYLKNYFPHKYDIVWVFDNSTVLPDNLPDEFRTVRYFSIEYLREICTAKYIICNSRTGKGHFFKKRLGQKYLQTWHSSLRLKCIEGDAIDTLPEEYVQIAKADSKKIDYILSGCKFSSDIIRRAFWYDGEILECGTPRIDYLLNQTQNKNELYQASGLDATCHYALYAPTFRKGDKMDAYDINPDRLVMSLKQKFGGEWRILYRLHPNLANRIRLNDLPECCINMTFYHDIQELLVISDVLITDYSSSMFDMAYLKKPCIIYASDLDDYIKNERNLYFNLSELPFPIAQDNDDLDKTISNFNVDTYNIGIDEFLKKIGSFEKGNACEQIVKKIMLH